MTNPFISIKSVLYKLSNLIPEYDWNEELFLEWSYEGLDKINAYTKFEHAVCTLPVSGHKATLPRDSRFFPLAFSDIKSSIDIIHDTSLKMITFIRIFIYRNDIL